MDGVFDDKFTKSARNLAKVSLLPAGGLNVYDILRRDTLVLTKRAVEKHINSIFLKLSLSYGEDVSKRVKATLLFLADADTLPSA